MKTESLFVVLAELWQRAPSRRRRQFVLILVLTLFGAVAEVLTLGALFPFLAFLADSGTVEQSSPIGQVLAVTGLGDLRDHALALALIFSTAAILAGMLRIVIAFATSRFVYAVCRDLSVKIFERVLSAPYRYRSSQNSSTVLSGLQHVYAVSVGVLMPTLQVASAAIIGLFIIAALIAVNPVVALLSFAGFALIYLAVSLTMRKLLHGNAAVIARAHREAVRTVQEGLGGIRDIIIDGTQSAFVARFAEFERLLRRAQATNYLAAAVPRFAVEAAGMALIAGGAALLVARTSSISDVFPLLGVFALGAQRLMPLLQLVYNNWALTIGNLAVVRVVLDLLDTPVERDRSGAPAGLLPFERTIVFKDVSFRYSDLRPPVVDRMDLTIVKGSKTMLIGKSGAGKSTVVDLLTGLLDPTSGAIEIDGRRLDATTRRSWQRQIAHVPQSIFLADASIAVNIAFGVPSERIDRDRVREAAERASLADFIATLPKGYETMVGERGVSLSGGQRQRIGIARAFYKRASVLVLDEATNALDADTEMDVLRSICAIDDITVIMIAHRLTARALCDQVVELDRGRGIVLLPSAGKEPVVAASGGAGAPPGLG